MKTIDFSKPGGLPLTQDMLALLQASYKDIFAALVTMGADTANIDRTPILLSGMVDDGAGNISDGYFYYNGEITKFTHGTIPIPSGGQELQVAIATAQSHLGLVFEDSSNPNVVLETGGTL